jgi:hypothetical protein
VSGAERIRISPIGELFRPDRVALWATTYNLDLDLFNGYLLGRLGEPPLNVVILADRDRLDTTLSSLPPERLTSLGPVNHRWLLRGVRLGTGRFHPKSYLAVTGQSVKLLVGSGNLSTYGLDGGREVFSAFSAGTPDGDAAIRTWLGWMRRIVSAVDDTTLAERFNDLQGRLRHPGLMSAVADSPLLHNLDQPLADQFCEHVFDGAGPVDELIVTAPFFDETGAALNRIMRRLQPSRVVLYTSATTKVDGAKLAARLSATDAEVAIFGYLPEAFTHAKLIGAVTGDHGWLLSGSANVSNAALTFAAGPAATGNVEIAVISRLPAQETRDAFLPPETTIEERTLESLATLTFEPGTETQPEVPYRITRAASQLDGRVEITTDLELDEDLRLADHRDQQNLVLEAPRATTAGPLAGPLVHLVDRSGNIVSNHAVIDDPEALRRALQVGGNPTASSRPAELTATDLATPLGRALQHLHRNVVMDVSEISGKGSGNEATRDEIQPDDEDDLWDRLEQEKLGRDPRASTYGRLFGHNAGPERVEPLIELLDAMRERTPEDSNQQSLLRHISGPVPPTNPGTGVPWSISVRVRVRARNVLRRWAAVQTDPRLTWVDPYAPLGNLKLVATTFARLWRYNVEPGPGAGLTADDLDELWLTWLRPFVGTGQGDGWLTHNGLSTDEIRARLDRDFAQIVTVLCWLAIRPGPRLRERIVEWQPVLRAILEQGLLNVDDDTEVFLSAAGQPATADRVETDLLRALDFIDDDLWSAQTAADLSLTSLKIEAAGIGPRTSIRLMVGGIEDPLNDPRVPLLLVSAGRYRHTDTVTIVGTEADWRLAVWPDEPIYFMASRGMPTAESVPVSLGTIQELAATNGVLAALFATAARTA